ncbi:MAG: response regulator transcription factor [Bacteroidota bacterium]
MIKVFIVEDQKLVLDGLKSLLKYEENIRVVGEASDGEEAIKLIKETQIDVALVDIELPLLNGLEVTKFIKKNYPNVKVLIISMYKTPEYINTAIDFGADGYMLKDHTDKDEMIFAINEVKKGELYFGKEIIKIDIKGRRIASSKENTKIKLTNREIEVLQHLSKGLSSQQIGEKLFIASSTVDTHRKHLLKKFGVSSTTYLVRKAMEGEYLK